jgi:predicted nucleic acid-binding Zn ribbon protein
MPTAAGWVSPADTLLWATVVRMATYEGYCVKCREKREFDGEVKEMANGRRAAQGTCPVCGTKMNRMLGKNG